MCQMLTDFMPPFFHSLQQKNLTVEMAEANLIPRWVCCDWTLYKDILFHVIQNAIKFNVDKGNIKVITSYHSFTEEFFVGNQQRDPLLLNAPKANQMNEQI